MANEGSSEIMQIPKPSQQTDVENNGSTGKRQTNKSCMKIWFISHTIVCWKLFTRCLSSGVPYPGQRYTSQNLHNNEVTLGAISVKNVVMRTAIEWEIDWNFMLMPLNHLRGIQTAFMLMMMLNTVKLRWLWICRAREKNLKCEKSSEPASLISCNCCIAKTSNATRMMNLLSAGTVYACSFIFR